MNKVVKHHNPEHFGRIAFTIAFALIGITGLVFYFVPQLEPILVIVGSLFGNINKIQLVDNQELECLYYAKTLCIDMVSLLPMIGIIWMITSEKINRKLKVFLIVVFALLMVAANVVTYVIPSSSLRSIPVKEELEDYQLFFFNWKHVYRFSQNFSAVYFFYAFPFVLQVSMFLLVFVFTRDYHKPVTYVFISLLFIVAAFIGSALIIAIVALLSALGMVLIIAGPVFIFIKLIANGDFSSSDSDTSEGGFFGYYPKGMHAGYASNDREVFHDGKGGYEFSDGTPYNGIVHCYPD